jgi:hypothetical protein
MKKFSKANRLRLVMITIAMVSILTFSATMPDFVQAGFTPTPQFATSTAAPPASNTPAPPTVAPTVAPTAAPTRRPRRRSSNQPAAVAAQPTPDAPLPATGSVGWWPMILLLWGGSLLLALPMVGPFRKWKRKSIPPQPSKKGGKHDQADGDA